MTFDELSENEQKRIGDAAWRSLTSGKKEVVVLDSLELVTVKYEPIDGEMEIEVSSE